jgi:hypothetical protein
VIAELIVLDPKVLDSYIIASPIKTTDVEKLISNKIIEERPLNQDIYLRADLIPTNT